MQVKYAVVDNRGKKRDMLPHEAFSAVQMVDGHEIVVEHCYTENEAIQVTEKWKRQRGIPK